MKKFYVKPESETLEIKVDTAILAGSLNEETGELPTIPGGGDDDDFV